MAVAFEAFLELDATARLRLLARLILDATIAGRGAYAPMSNEVENGPRLRGVNEFIHRLVNVMNHLLDDTPNAESYARAIWNDQIRPWADARPGQLEALVEEVAASDL
jgi:hypothetical protein